MYFPPHAPSSAISSILMFHHVLQGQDTVLPCGTRWDRFLFNLHTPYTKTNQPTQTNRTPPPPPPKKNHKRHKTRLPGLSSSLPLHSSRCPGAAGGCQPSRAAPQQALPEAGGGAGRWFWAQPLPQAALPAGCEHTGPELCWGKRSQLHTCLLQDPCCVC